MKLINGHLSYYFHDSFDIAIHKRIYEVLKANPVILIEFEAYLYGKNRRTAFQIKAFNENWHAWCSLIGLKENKTVNQLRAEEGGKSRERYRQILARNRRRFGRFLKEKDYCFAGFNND